MKLASFFDVNAERIREAVSVASLCERYGVELVPCMGALMGSCPLCGKAEGFVVFPRENRWSCVGCKRVGGNLELVMEHEGMSFDRAAEELGRFLK